MGRPKLPKANVLTHVLVETRFKNFAKAQGKKFNRYLIDILQENQDLWKENAEKDKIIKDLRTLKNLKDTGGTQ